jgi:hypothetical protein
MSGERQPVRAGDRVTCGRAHGDPRRGCRSMRQDLNGGGRGQLGEIGVDLNRPAGVRLVLLSESLGRFSPRVTRWPTHQVDPLATYTNSRDANYDTAHGRSGAAHQTSAAANSSDEGSVSDVGGRCVGPEREQRNRLPFGVGLPVRA